MELKQDIMKPSSSIDKKGKNYVNKIQNLTKLFDRYYVAGI